MSAIVDTARGEVAAIAVVGRGGARYLATVDPSRPSQLVLRAVEGRGGAGRGAAYTLPTRYEALDLANRRQVESIFRVAGWEDSLQPRRN